MTALGGPAAGERRVGEAGRFLVPLDAPPAACWLFDRLYPPHGLRGRVRRRAGAAAARRAVRTGRRLAGWPFDRVWRLGAVPERWADALAAAAVLGGPRRREAGGPPPGADAWVIGRDEPSNGRRRTVLFRFGAGEAVPRDLVKLRPLEAPGAPLARERDALADLARRLPAELSASVPRPLEHGRTGGFELLRLSTVPGRSAYVEMLAAPRDVARIASAFAAAARWLAELHSATRSAAPWRPSPWEELGEGPAPAWHRQLAAAVDAPPLRPSVGHGDFWPRNLLLDEADRARPSVVDWEASRPAAPPLLDLFDFPLSYGLSYPWPEGGGPETAFRRTFLADSAVSRAVRSYAALYAKAAGWSADLLEPMLRLYLRMRATDRGPFAGRRPTDDPAFWRRCERLLDEAEGCALSG